MAPWNEVEPAIFGTLLERALDPDERHRLGAHYTPRAYVERLVLPTVIEPLREDWKNTPAAALTLETEGDSKGAVAEVRRFHQQLCATRVLDPACASGKSRPRWRSFGPACRSFGDEAGESTERFEIAHACPGEIEELEVGERAQWFEIAHLCPGEIERLEVCEGT